MAWIAETAAQYGGFEVEVLDLATINLPLMNEAHHPVLKKYEHSYTKQWSAAIDEAEAFIFVTAEYDHNYPAPLRNAIEYLYHEWGYKAAGIVSYGGVSAGTRAFAGLKSDLVSVKVVPVMEAVHIPFFTQHINDEDAFIPTESMATAANTMLKELKRWSTGLKPIRENKV